MLHHHYDITTIFFKAAGQGPFAVECMNLITINEYNVTVQAPSRNMNFICFDSLLIQNMGYPLNFVIIARNQV